MERTLELLTRGVGTYTYITFLYDNPWYSFAGAQQPAVAIYHGVIQVSRGNLRAHFQHGSMNSVNDIIAYDEQFVKLNLLPNYSVQTHYISYPIPHIFNLSVLESGTLLGKIMIICEFGHNRKTLSFTSHSQKITDTSIVSDNLEINAKLLARFVQTHLAAFDIQKISIVP